MDMKDDSILVLSYVEKADDSVVLKFILCDRLEFEYEENIWDRFGDLTWTYHT